MGRSLVALRLRRHLRAHALSVAMGLARARCRPRQSVVISAPGCSPINTVARPEHTATRRRCCVRRARATATQHHTLRAVWCAAHGFITSHAAAMPTPASRCTPMRAATSPSAAARVATPWLEHIRLDGNVATRHGPTTHSPASVPGLDQSPLPPLSSRLTPLPSTPITHKTPSAQRVCAAQPVVATTLEHVCSAARRGAW